jgi:hypothetical protein
VVHAALTTACLILSGCGGPSPDNADFPTSAVAPSGTRPMDLPLDGIDPCMLLAPPQRSSLRIDQPGQQTRVETPSGDGCTWNGRGVSHLVVPVIDQGIETWVGRDAPGPVLDAGTVHGFHAVITDLTDAAGRCDLAVDVAHGQYLAVMFTVAEDSRAQHPQPCDTARRLADAVIGTVTGRD